jgi:hypothetical protein
MSRTVTLRGALAEAFVRAKTGRSVKPAAAKALLSKLAGQKRTKRVVIRGIVRVQPDGDFLEVSRTKTTVGMLALGAVLNTHGWKNKKVRITISEVSKRRPKRQRREHTDGNQR